MSKKWILRVGLVTLAIFIAYFVISPLIDASFIFENFPLTEKWSARLNENIQQISIADRQVVLVRTASGIGALDLKTGKTLWHRDTGWRAGNEPALSKNGVVFFTDNKRIWALKLLDGEVLWSQRLHSRSAKVAAVTTDMVAVFDWQQLFVYRTSDGTLLLRKSVCRNSYLTHIYNSRLYYPCSGMIAVDIDSGETIWETEEYSAITAAAYSDGILYSDPSVDVITAFNLEGQKQIWSVPIVTARVYELKVADEFLFMTDRKQFCVLERSSGRILWCEGDEINQQNPTKIGDEAYVFNGRQNVITAFDVHSGTKLGHLAIRNIKLFVSSQKMGVEQTE